MTGKGKKKKVTVLAERLQEGLSEIERKFLLAAELGDIDVIRNLLESNSVSANKADTQGRTALDLAIASGQEDIVLYLIDKVSPRILQNGLISAVENGRAELCEILLKHPLYQTVKTTETDVYSSLDGVSYGSKDRLTVTADDISDTSKTSQYVRIHTEKMLKEALMKAAIKNNFQIVQMIMLKGVCLDFPHDYFCSCGVCISEQQKDYMVFCNKRLDTFRALASPAYISLTEEDPIMASFHLSKRFQELIAVETEYQQTYLELDQQVQQFSLDLLDQCRSSEEVGSLLSYAEGDNDTYFPLLSTALKMEQKRFVAHAKCQAQVSALWFTGLQILRNMNRFEFLILSIPVGMVVLPILSLVYIVAPWSKVNMLLNNPSTRFLSYTCSFISFLCLIVIGKLQVGNIWLSLGCDIIEPYVYVFVAVIFMWIVGWIWEEMKQVYDTGAYDYFRSIWNVIDSLMLTFLLASFTLDVVVPIRVSESIKNHPLFINVSGEIITISMIPFCYSVEEGASYLQDNAVCSSSRIAIQADWSPSWVPDPELISDIFFSVGIILSIARISFIMPANETFGTMLVSFRRTFGDVIKLCAMFILILVSFSCGIAALYAAHRCQTQYFNDMGNTLFLLLWSLLGFGPSDAAELNPAQPMSSITNNPARDKITVFFGYVFYGIYVFAALVVLMNLLIAVMSNTFQEVQDERDIEWKFARTELWMTFIEPGCPVAPPFNIIPTPRSIAKLYRWVSNNLKRCCLSCKRRNKEQSHRRAKDVENKEEEQVDKMRQETLCTLIRRYIVFAEREKSEGDEDATEDKLRRLIERVASKQDKRLDEIQNRVMHVDDHVHNVQRGGQDIQSMQHAEIELTQKLIEMQEKYRKMLESKWEEVNKFREDRLQEVREMRKHRRQLLEAGRLSDAQEMEEKISDALEDAEYVPRTTIQ